MNNEFTDEQIIKTITLRAHNDVLRALISGDLSATIDESEVDEEGIDWLRSKGVSVALDDAPYLTIGSEDATE